MICNKKDEFEKDKIRKHKRLHDGHLTYRQEADIKHRSHHIHIRGAKKKALEDLRLANHGLVRSNAGSRSSATGSSSMAPSSPPGRPQRKPSPRNRKMRLTGWRKITGDNNEIFYQNVSTLEVEWEIPSTGVLYDSRNQHEGMLDTHAFQTVFDELSSHQWRATPKKGSQAKKRKEETGGSAGTHFDDFSDDVMGISSLRFDMDNFFPSK